MAAITSPERVVITEPVGKGSEADAALSGGHGRRPEGPIAWIVAGSLAAGVAAAAFLVLTPLCPAREHAVTSAVLLGFGFGWALLAVLSRRLTDQPQRWATAPALLMGTGGLLLWAVPATDTVLRWMWPAATLATATWMATRAHRQLRSRSGRRLLYPVIALMALASIGGGYQTIQETINASAHPAPGQMIDVGGHRLHLNCTGSGSPTVLLEPGAGGMSATLGWITPAVARGTRVCVYDRAGRGWSEPAHTRQDANQIAADLHELLQQGHVPGPYVLAGHSFGGLYVLTFAARYPDEVAGMVLIDSTAPAPQPGAQSPSNTGPSDLTDRLSTLASATARLGLGSVLGWLAADGLPPRFADEVRAGFSSANAMRSTIDEYTQAGASARQAGSLATLSDKPLIVITAGREHPASWFQAQDQLATLSINSAHRTITDATHATLITEQKPAAATAQAILDVVAAVRNASPPK